MLQLYGRTLATGRRARADRRQTSGWRIGGARVDERSGWRENDGRLWQYIVTNREFRRTMGAIAFKREA